MSKARSPDGQQYEGKFELPVGPVRLAMRKRLICHCKWLHRRYNYAVRNARPNVTLLDAALCEVLELLEQIRKDGVYVWYMPLTPEEAAALERKPNV